MAHGRRRAAPVHMPPIGTGPSIGAAEVGLPMGSVAGKSSQRHHSVLAGGGQQGTSRKTQVCCMFWKEEGQRSAEATEAWAARKSPT